jgi:hypothetical protein
MIFDVSENAAETIIFQIVLILGFVLVVCAVVLGIVRVKKGEMRRRRKLTATVDAQISRVRAMTQIPEVCVLQDTDVNFHGNVTVIEQGELSVMK